MTEKSKMTFATIERDRFGNKKLVEAIEKQAEVTGLQEPYFILRGQDAFAAELVRQWAHLAESAGVPRQKVENARQCARAMRNWPTKKIPD